MTISLESWIIFSLMTRRVRDASQGGSSFCNSHGITIYMYMCANIVPSVPVLLGYCRTLQLLILNHILNSTITLNELGNRNLISKRV